MENFQRVQPDEKNKVAKSMGPKHCVNEVRTHKIFRRTPDYKTQVAKPAGTGLAKPPVKPNFV